MAKVDINAAIKQAEADALSAGAKHALALFHETSPTIRYPRIGKDGREVFTALRSFGAYWRVSGTPWEAGGSPRAAVVYAVINGYHCMLHDGIFAMFPFGDEYKNHMGEVREWLR